MGEGSLKDKVLFITGGSRGIGLAIAKRAARDGAKVAIAAKTAEPHPKLPGTIYTAAEEIRQAGGEALPIVCDIRHEDQVAAAIARTVEQFGGLDILVNNASAISLTGTLQTPMKRFDLMHQVNARGTFMTTKLALPHLLEAENPHVLMLSPPLSMKPHWFAPHVAYTMAKYGMSMCVLGMAEEFRGRVAFNALWPRTAIATAAVANLLGGEEMIRRSRKPEIVADAAHWILTQPAHETTGHFFIDEEVLRRAGVTDFDAYAVEPGQALVPDLFVDLDPK
ncbi:MAG: NAD(P)-dependent oxidoreductase [Alphaproteobacteria bacterium]|nr:MAG: NAD(P)-dependent oxidoreductase [Alphaproteobacteria bacterium]